MSSTDVISKLISLALFGITCLVYTQTVTDPVNAPKLFALGGLSFSVLGVFLSRELIASIKKFKIVILAIALFSIASINSLILSNAPLSQQLYGVYGRNNGFLLYFALMLLFLGTLTFQEKRHFLGILYALFAAGLINIVYGLWTVAFGDPVGWSNPYGNLLGTLGNPNFAGSFLGLFSCVLFAILLDSRLNRNLKLLVIPLIALDLFCIQKTSAVQGKVLFLVAFAFSFFCFLKNKFNSKLLISSYVSGCTLISAFALLGALQIGPLTKYIYKTSVSLRGEYWAAGWNTGMSHPFSGVGFDTFADWYRRSRRESALVVPGVDTVTNTAHNVYLDIFSFGGFPLLGSYIVLSILVAASIIRMTLKVRKNDWVFVGLASTWICYQLQSLISINQVGLAIWGWALGGAILSYERFAKSEPTETKADKRSKRVQTEVFTPWLRAGVASVIGFIVFVPPFSSDIKWRQAQISQSAEKIENVLDPSYLNPLNSFTINNIVGVFETSNLPEFAHKYGLKAVALNPENYDSWKNLYLISGSTAEEKAQALKIMKRLDPNNSSLGK